MGLGVCNICGCLHYTSECQYSLVESESTNPTLPKLEEIIELLKSKTHLNLGIGFYSTGAIQLRITDNFDKSLAAFSEGFIEKDQDIFELVIQKIKEL